MKVHIVLSHKLVEMDILGVKPPLLPLGCKIRGDADITYTGFKLDTVNSCVLMTKWCEPTHTSTKKSLDRVSRLAKALTEDLSLHVLIRVVIFDGNGDTPL